jgi:hypothetical protein
MAELNPVRLEARLRDTFRRYLYTANLISPREPELQDEFWRLLGEERRIVHGPLLQCSPAYRASFSLRELVAGAAGFPVSRELLRLAPAAFDPDRPLYTHQVEALRRLGPLGRNLIVSTGTGSGKSECFLLPIFDAVLHEPQPGLRAIVIYPMNALANDQLSRLRALLRELPEIRFGRYTSDTPHRDDAEHPRDEAAPPNECFTRGEMWEQPPHLLLTNFAMLEYLLLRPRDSELFRGHRLQFLVLDEAHTYAGAQGIEIGYLIRRLRQHLGLTETGPQCILTSATLGSGADADQKIREFARDLTDAAFNADDVLRGERVHSFEEKLDGSLPSDEQLAAAAPDDAAFAQWDAALENADGLRQRLSALGIATGAPATASAAQILHEVFSRSEALSRLHTACARKPLTAAEALEELNLPTDEAGHRALAWLLAMGANARRDASSSPLLPARLHFLFRGLAGGCLCVNPACHDRGASSRSWSRLYLEDRQRCDACTAHVLPLRTCVHCGLVALPVFLDDANGAWRFASDPIANGGLRPAILALQPIGDDEEDEDAPASSVVTLCLHCQSFASGPELAHCCTAPAVRTFQSLRGVNEQGHLPRCPQCSGAAGAFQTVLRAFRTGEDAPAAVLTEALMRELPPEPGRSDKPAEGRSLLVFSDSRQRAAFFAPYLKNTTAETVYLGPLLEALRAVETDSDAAPIGDIVQRFMLRVQQGVMSHVALRERDEDGFEHYRIIRAGGMPVTQRNQLRREAQITLARHACASPSRADSLSGLALAAVTFDVAEDGWAAVRALVPELFANGDAAGRDIFFLLLRTMLRRGAVQFPDSFSAREVLDLAPNAPAIFAFHRANRYRHGAREVSRWNPFHTAAHQAMALARSRPRDLLARALGAEAVQDGALLDRVWDAFQRAQLLVPEETHPGEFRIDLERILFTTRSTWHVCESCGRLTAHGAAGICPSFECGGSLRELPPEHGGGALARNHYRHRFQSPAFPLEVKEHTAQLTNEVGRLYQERFVRGEINVLSSSTTFEMGVDVGGLKAVLLRNVPPAASNYVQRAGRAGRRRDGVAVAVTYARNMPHDQHHYSSPGQLVGGNVPPPVLAMENPVLAQRHVNSLLLGAFLRALSTRHEPGALDRADVDLFFLHETATGEPPPALQFASWIESERLRLLSAVAAILPADLALSPEAALAAAARTLASDDAASVLIRHVREPLARYEEQIAELAEAALNTTRDSLRRLVGQFRRQRLIDFLSSAAWLPGYAFPQDIVKLIVRNPEHAEDMRLERDREVGLSEYAPGAEIVADGRLFTSRAVWFGTREPEFRWYVRCPQCRKIEMFLETEAPAANCARCGTALTGAAVPRRCHKPDAFSTHIDDVPCEPGPHRQRPPRSSEVFLLEGTDEKAFSDHPAIAGVRFGVRNGGRLLRVNMGASGRGYGICRRCGLASDSAPLAAVHTAPWGAPCHGPSLHLHLVHEITTDVLQLRFSGTQPAAPPMSNRSFWLSFRSAFLRAACEELAIATADIDATHNGWSNAGGAGELVLYDRVPGGAGHIPRIIESLDDVLRAALARVENCANCTDLDASCYACLRTYGNQFDWPNLQRRGVRDWLSAVFS